MENWKYIPDHVACMDWNRSRFYPSAPVVEIKLHPPIEADRHPGTAIRGDWFLAEVITTVGKRTYGFVDGFIDGSLRMAVRLGPGQERDEVIAKWQDAPGRPRDPFASGDVRSTMGLGWNG